MEGRAANEILQSFATEVHSLPRGVPTVHLEIPAAALRATLHDNKRQNGIAHAGLRLTGHGVAKQMSAEVLKALYSSL